MGAGKLTDHDYIGKSSHPCVFSLHGPALRTVRMGAEDPSYWSDQHLPSPPISPIGLISISLSLPSLPRTHLYTMCVPPNHTLAHHVRASRQGP